MKKMIPLIFFIGLVICLIPRTFSQQPNANKLRLSKEEANSIGYWSDHTLNSRIFPDSTRPDTTKKKDKPKSWWETLLDFSFWNKLSGPGPFIGAGIEYPVFKFTNVAIFVGGSVSHSLDNTLQYYKTVTDTVVRRDSMNNPIFVAKSIDSCIQCKESKAVQMVSLMINAQYRIPKSKFDLLFGFGLHTFFGETFATFSRVSGVFGAGWRVLKYIRVGFMVNVFDHFKPSKFGAVDGKDSTGSVEFVPGAFVSVSLH